jgi:hypothetical protein
MKASEIKISNSVDELFFIIAPPPHIKSDVSVLKDDVQYLTGRTFADRYSTAHIALFRFDDKKHFYDIVREVTSKAIHFDPFNIFIEGLHSFWDGAHRTICLDVSNKFPVREIFEKTIKENALYTPYISIAKRLGDEDFENVWPYLKDFHYSQHFLCDRITVLARTENRWNQYREIPFGDS